MKILVTFEKEDILQLLQEKLIEQGFNLVEGKPLIYKGALNVKLEVEVTNDVKAKQEDTEPVPNTKLDAPKKKDKNDEEDLKAILEQSNNLFNEGNVGRVLGQNETMEYPK